MKKYRIIISVKEVRGHCAINYKPGDSFVVEWFYVIPESSTKICLHALSAMTSLLMPFLKGVSAVDLGIGAVDDVGYIQCPDPGEPYTTGGTVIFELKREEIPA